MYRQPKYGLVPVAAKKRYRHLMEGPLMVFLFIVVAVAVGGVMLAIWYFSPTARARRALRAAQRVPVAEALDGQLVKLVGLLRLDPAAQELTSPLTGRRCAYFEASVDQRKSSGKSSHWRTIIREQDFAGSFYIKDASGEALVEGLSPKVVLNMDAHFSSGTFDDATPRLERFLSRHGESSEGWVFNKTLRYTEGVLEEGELVAVFGLCAQEPDPDPRAGGRGGYRERAMRIKLTKPAEGELLISDDPRTLD
jgi:hypothetical protein